MRRAGMGRDGAQRDPRSRRPNAHRPVAEPRTCVASASAKASNCQSCDAARSCSARSSSAAGGEASAAAAASSPGAPVSAALPRRCAGPEDLRRIAAPCSAADARVTEPAAGPRPEWQSLSAGPNGGAPRAARVRNEAAPQRPTENGAVSSTKTQGDKERCARRCLPPEARSGFDCSPAPSGRPRLRALGALMIAASADERLSNPDGSPPAASSPLMLPLALALPLRRGRGEPRRAGTGGFSLGPLLAQSPRARRPCV